MKKNSYCMHGLNKDIIEKYILTFPENSLVFFDDGLASLYKYKDFLKEYKKVHFIIAINPYVVLNADKEKEINIEYIECAKAHDLIKRKRDFSHYLNSEMIKGLSEYCEIADHSWDHFLFDKNIYKVKLKLSEYNEKIKKSLKFYEEIKITPKKYVRPYNRENPIYEMFIIKKFKINKENIYGGERISGAWNSYEKDKS
jgi:hypothetical protein